MKRSSSMGARTPDAGHTLRSLERAYRDVVRDTAEVTGARLVELLIGRERAPAPPWCAAALAVPRAPDARRFDLARILARSPALVELPEPRRRASLRVGLSDVPLTRAL